MAHILIVEDDINLLNVNKSYFEREGHIVHTASTVAEALFTVDENVPDVMILDVMLPDGDGFELLKKIRKFTDAPAIFLTCRDENDSVLTGFSSGADDYVTKPYELSLLSARVNVLLRRRERVQDPVIELPGLRIDMISGTVTMDGVDYFLPQKELQIMYLLMTRIGQRVTCSEIYTRIYGDDVGDSTNVIRVNLSRMKKHLEMTDASSYALDRTIEGDYVLHRVMF